MNFWAIFEMLFRVKGSFMEMSWRGSEWSARWSCCWNKGERGHLHLARRWMIVAISDYLLLSSLCPGTVDPADPWADWQEQEGKPGRGLGARWVKQPEQGNHMGMTWCCQWVSLQTVIWRPIAGLALQDGWKRAKKQLINYTLFYLCIFIFTCAFLNRLWSGFWNRSANVTVWVGPAP